MSRDLNKAMITGRLGKDPDIKYLQSGQPVANFTVASGREWKDKDGGKGESTEWFNVVVWGKLAEVCGKYLTKGSKVLIEGRIETKKWEKDGINHYKTELIASEMIMLSSKGQGDDSAQTHVRNIPEFETEDDIPF